MSGGGARGESLSLLQDGRDVPEASFRLLHKLKGSLDLAHFLLQGLVVVGKKL